MVAQKKEERAVTQKDLDLNPKLVAKGVEVGDVMKLPPLPEEDEDVEDTDEEDESNSDESDEDEDEKQDPKAKASGAKQITFTIKSPNPIQKTTTRTFDEATHGADFEALADSFEKANTTIKPTLPATDPAYKEHVEEVNTFNKTVTQPIIAKVIA